MVSQLGWLSPVEGSADGGGTYPQLSETLTDMNEASQFAIWLDTVTAADVASAYLSGVEGLLGGKKSPAQVMDDVRKAAEKAKRKAG
jgi:raffinose/stachyose/melibiose transport system substrate-binding protein